MRQIMYSISRFLKHSGRNCESVTICPKVNTSPDKKKVYIKNLFLQSGKSDPCKRQHFQLLIRLKI